MKVWVVQTGGYGQQTVASVHSSFAEAVKQFSHVGRDRWVLHWGQLECDSHFYDAADGTREFQMAVMISALELDDPDPWAELTWDTAPVPAEITEFLGQ